MALDLSEDRYGSKAAPNGSHLTGEEIMNEADRIAKVKKDAAIIASEVAKELERVQETTTVQEPVAETTVVVVESQSAAADYMPFLCIGGGILIGILIAAIFFKMTLNKVVELANR